MLGHHTIMLFKYRAIQKHCTKEACSVTPSERARMQPSCLPGAPERPPVTDCPAAPALPCTGWAPGLLWVGRDREPLGAGTKE